MSSKEIEIIYHMQQDNIKLHQEVLKLHQEMNQLKAEKKCNNKMHCAICLEDQKKTKTSYITLQCAHSVHLTCFMNFVSKSDSNISCPLCRYQYKLPPILSEFQDLKEKLKVSKQTEEYLRQELRRCQHPMFHDQNGDEISDIEEEDTTNESTSTITISEHMRPLMLSNPLRNNYEIDAADDAD